ncbi:hypothetical protein T07_3210 [Trichinella nelsoni]|uniref:Uncharacterized protein n=1 Tax=Trichinella nelsoni TaxID=6336 RepID=A0A0V0RGR6_9BILA|nr:hypothetical protein T07_3210 [Trichinella nelsoni]
MLCKADVYKGSELTSVMAFLLIETQLGRVHHATSGFFSPRPKANKNQNETPVLSNQAGRCALASRPAKQFFFQTSLQKHLPMAKWIVTLCCIGSLTLPSVDNLENFFSKIQLSCAKFEQCTTIRLPVRFMSISAKEEEEEEGKRCPFCSLFHLYNFDENLEN